MTTAHTGSGDLARSLELLWQGRERPGRGPRPTLTLEQIVAAAVTLADRDGLGALSMRRVAAELGVGTMTLYRYVPGKGELLDLMLDYVVALREGTPPPEPGRWRDTMEKLAENTWRLYVAHPWLLGVNQTRPVLGPNTLAGLNHALVSLRGLGLTGREKVAMILAVEHYVTGTARTHILAQRAAEESGVTDEEFWNAHHPALETAMGSGAYPEVFTLPPDSFFMGGDAMLDFGLRPLLDGFERLIAERASAGPPTEEGGGCR